MPTLRFFAIAALVFSLTGGMSVCQASSGSLPVLESVFSVPSFTSASESGMPELPGQEGSPSDFIGDSLLAGSLVGSFFGYPYKGLGVADMVMGTVLIFVALKLFLAFGIRPGQNSPTGFGSEINAGQDGSQARSLPTIKEQAASSWDRLRSTSLPEEFGGRPAATAPSLKTPQGFDTADFLEGAKLLYARLQTAWAARNIDGLRDFITPEMLEVLEEQGEAHPEISTIEVLLITPTLLEVSREGSEERVKVLFKALLQEGEGSNSQSFEVSEIWYFTHDFEASSSWQLDGIEQVSGDTT